jgi:hypothetical protein
MFFGVASADLSTMLPDYSEVRSELLAVAAMVAGVIVVRLAIRWVFKALRGSGDDYSPDDPDAF